MSTAKTARAITYDHDFHDWAMEQARALRDRQSGTLDWDNLAEEIESLGRSDQREVTSRLTMLLVHLLKWRHQPESRSDSWSDTIARERLELPLIFEQSPSLARFAGSTFMKAYRLARKEAARQTRLAPATFPTDPSQALSEEYLRARRAALDDTGLPADRVPKRCPFSIDEVLDANYWPEAERA